MADPEKPQTNSGLEIDKTAAWLEQIVREPVPNAILTLTAKLQNELDARSAGQGIGAESVNDKEKRLLGLRRTGRQSG